MAIDRGSKSDVRQRRMFQLLGAGQAYTFGNGLEFDEDSGMISLMIASPPPAGGLNFTGTGALTIDLKDANPGLEFNLTGLAVLLSGLSGLSLAAGLHIVLDPATNNLATIGASGLLVGSPLTTAGDLWTFTTLNTRLPVGTNGQVLTVDTSLPGKLKYATPAAGSAPDWVKLYAYERFT